MKKFKILFIIILGILGIVLFFSNDILDFYSKLSLKLSTVEKEVGDFLIKEAERRVSTPPPLRFPKQDPEAFLTPAGIIRWTNIQRQRYGLPLLRENKKLNSSAGLKIQDMFKNQYFSHFSPSGIEVKDLAENVSYEFIAIGENLALGDFQNDEMLLQAWIDSPGHRENILSSRYQEIGVAVGKALFEGRETWLAVQHFGLPLSACPGIEKTLEFKIEQNKNQIKELQKILEVLETEILKTRPKSGLYYNQKLEEYNFFVSQYNNLIKETEVLISEYNNRVRVFNECVGGLK